MLTGEEDAFRRTFKDATGHEAYPYQARLATGDELPQLVDVPTGMGKTAGAVLAWLWRRRFASDEVRKATPRRLVYCLPMRVLVEQTRDNVILWLHRLGLLGGEVEIEDGKVLSYKPSWDDEDKIAVTVLMGGEDKDQWDLYPERDAVIIGTQDMLLSRALNRGYGMSRYRWPMHFGLLNNDCLWIMDEVQLMGVGVETSAQLQAFRDKLGTQGTVSTLWMSATLGQGQLETVDHPRPGSGWPCQRLEKDELGDPKVMERTDAKKKLEKATVKLDKAGAEGSYAEAVADLLISNHEKGTLTLAVVNRVKRAQGIFRALIKKGRTEGDTAVIHSRFREGDRAERMKILTANGDRIVVATQVVEAGVDVSAHTLITELAPWPSLVQRFGRCNRYGKQDNPVIIWIDIDPGNDSDELALPYEAGQLMTARENLSKITDARPSALASVPYEAPAVTRPVIRRKDILDLFDTTTDLTGNDLYVSRYIRDGQDTDVQVYWRDTPEEGPSGALDTPRRDELCSVSIGEMSKYLKKNMGWRWDPLEARWRSVGKGGQSVAPRPGQVLLLDPKNGGYTRLMGWMGADSNDVVTVMPPAAAGGARERTMNDDDDSHLRRWVRIVDHDNAVSEEVGQIASGLGLSQGLSDALTTAALWHDAGKAHPGFQNMLVSGRPDEARLRNDLWAKSDTPATMATCWVDGGAGQRIERPYFRHELASSLAWLQTNGGGCTDADLIAYIIAAHHGKVRVSIRSLPKENEPLGDETLFARGIWDGDRLPPIPAIVPNDTVIDLSIMRMGTGSWLERMLRLRDGKETGPFRMSLLETALRSADWRVSSREGV